MDDKQLVIQRWIQKASHDLYTAQTMRQVDDVPTDVVCFHCQQCAEKSLKAFLVSGDQNTPRTHDVVKLLSLCRTFLEGFFAMEESAISLADYAVEVRYPDDGREIPGEEASEALPKAPQVLSPVRRELNAADARKSRKSEFRPKHRTLPISGRSFSSLQVRRGTGPRLDLLPAPPARRGKSCGEG